MPSQSTVPIMFLFDYCNNNNLVINNLRQVFFNQKTIDYAIIFATPMANILRCYTII